MIQRMSIRTQVPKVGGLMSKRALKHFVRLRPDQILRVPEECIVIGPYRVVRVYQADGKTTVTVRFKDGKQKKVTV